jgi:thiamine transport system ATP-binding protein
VLTIEDLTVRYDEHVALDGIDLTVAEHEIVCVLGPSGSGKSTLLRTIAGLEVPSHGRVARDGEDLAGVPTHRRGLGLMFQDHALFPHRDVVGNVAFGLRMHGADRRDARARAATALARVGLAGYEGRGVHELSGGEQQRVALARAVAPEPSLLMLDEPLGALDRALREQLVDELGALFRDIGLAVLLVTHDHDEAFALADRVAVLRAGRIEQIGTPQELWTRPATAFVADFLGWNVTRAFGPGLAAVRPDAVHLAASGPGSTSGPEATVTGRTFRRDHWRVRVELGDGSGLDVELRETRPPEPGTPVRITLDPGALVALPDEGA